MKNFALKKKKIIVKKIKRITLKINFPFDRMKVITSFTVRATHNI